jgi:hypothetical protein
MVLCVHNRPPTYPPPPAPGESRAYRRQLGDVPGGVLPTVPCAGNTTCHCRAQSRLVSILRDQVAAEKHERMLSIESVGHTASTCWPGVSFIDGDDQCGNKMGRTSDPIHTLPSRVTGKLR